MSGVFFVKHYKGKKKEEIQKTKLPKHVERKLFFEKNPPTRKRAKKGVFFFGWQEHREEIFPFDYRKNHTKEKWTKK